MGLGVRNTVRLGLGLGFWLLGLIIILGIITYARLGGQIISISPKYLEPVGNCKQQLAGKIEAAGIIQPPAEKPYLGGSYFLGFPLTDPGPRNDVL